MGGTRINNFFSYVSGRYAVKHDKWRGVNLCVNAKVFVLDLA